MSDKPVFDPSNLTPVVSINLVKIVDLPGLDLEEVARNNFATRLLSAEPIVTLVRQHLAEVAVSGTVSGDLLAWDGAFSSDDETIRDKARLVATLMGRRLGYLLATLKRGDEVNRQARPNWQDIHWSFWAGIKQIWLGGGLVSGRAAPHILAAAEQLLVEARVTDLSINLSFHTSHLALIGVARSLHPDQQVALVFDFGQSWVKRALAFYREGSLVTLQLLNPVSSSPFANMEKNGELYQKIHEVTVITWQEIRRMGYDPYPEMGLSVASYVSNNTPYARQEPVNYDFSGELAGKISREVDCTVKLHLTHDGTAAARTHAGREKAAIIMLGTYLGIGFPPVSEGLCPIAPDFEIRPV